MNNTARRRYSRGRSLKAMLQSARSAQAKTGAGSSRTVAAIGRGGGDAVLTAATAGTTMPATSTRSAPETCARAAAKVMPGVAKPAISTRRVNRNRIGGSDRGSNALRPWAMKHCQRKRFPTAPAVFQRRESVGSGGGIRPSSPGNRRKQPFLTHRLVILWPAFCTTVKMANDGHTKEPLPWWSTGPRERRERMQGPTAAIAIATKPPISKATWRNPGGTIRSLVGDPKVSTTFANTPARQHPPVTRAPRRTLAVLAIVLSRVAGRRGGHWRHLLPGLFGGRREAGLA